MDISIVESFFEEYVVINKEDNEHIFNELEHIELNLKVDKWIPIEYRFKNMRCFEVYLLVGQYEVNSYVQCSLERANELYLKDCHSDIQYLLIGGTKEEMVKFKLKY